MECLVCKGKLEKIISNDIEIIKCNKCKGFWVKSGDLNRIVKHKAGDIEFSSIDHHFHKDIHGIIKCIYCNDIAMIKINFIEFSDIILDFCEICGAFWVDNGELEKMQIYIDTIEDTGTKKTIAEIIMNLIYSLPKV